MFPKLATVRTNAPDRTYLDLTTMKYKHKNINIIKIKIQKYKHFIQVLLDSNSTSADVESDP